MKNILVLLKINLKELKKNKFMLMLILIGVPIFLGCGAIFSSECNILKSKVSVYCQNDIEARECLSAIEGYEKINLIYVNEEPAKIELLTGKYLAEIKCNKENVEIISYRNNDEIRYLRYVLLGEEYDKSTSTTVIFKSIGFLTIFLFMVSKLLMGRFLEQRENGIMGRVLMGHISFYEYAIAQLIFNAIAIFVPTIIVSIIFINLVLISFNISITYYILLIALIVVVGSSLAFCIFNCFIDKTTVEFVSSMVILLSSIIGGAIVDVQDTDVVIAILRGWLPQKMLLNLSNKFDIVSFMGLIVMSIVLVLVGIYVGKKKCDEGVYI